MLLTGCVMVVSKCPEPTVITVETQLKIKDELLNIPEDAAINELVIAYLNDRDKLRACNRISY